MTSLLETETPADGRGARIADDPVALRDPRRVRFFAWIMARQMRGAFRAVRLLRPGLPALPDGPVVIYANHPGWWDPAFFIVLHDRLLGARTAFGVMEAAALDRYAFMKRIGLFGVEPGTRAGAARFLRVSDHVLSQPGALIWMTAQGRFADPRERPAALQGGLPALMRRRPLTALPLALEYPFWSEKRPEALAAFGAPVTDPDALAPALEAAQDRLAEAALARDASRFEDVMRGRQGQGGIYGAWQRARALATGRRYDPSHLSDGTR